MRRVVVEAEEERPVGSRVRVDVVNGAIGPDGAAYVTNFSIVPGAIPGLFPDGGTVVRITLD